MITAGYTTTSLDRPLTLPCGVILKNRLVKSAMSDSLGDGEGNPTDAQIRLYERWAEGNVALSLIGEVQIDPRFPEKPGNLVLGEDSDLDALGRLAARAAINDAHIWPQLGHAGALSHAPISQPMGPSALQINGFECAEMPLSDVQQLPQTYAKAASIAKRVGFTGVQIHAGHGFLLSQFLSPLFNHRNDQYGGTIADRCQILLEIIDAVRKVVGNGFPIGIKINSSDQLQGGLNQQDALSAIVLLDKTSLDLIEISGGTYFPGAKSCSENAGGKPYFVDFASKTRSITNIPLVATGGFKGRKAAQDALAQSAVDMVGVGRAFALNPSLANDWINGANIDPIFPKFDAPPEGGITAWYTMLLTALGNNAEETFTLDLPSAIRIYEERDAQKTIQWRKKYIRG